MSAKQDAIWTPVALLAAAVLLTEVAQSMTANAASAHSPHSTPNPVSTPSILPTQPPATVWRIRLTGYPDSIGLGGYACQGCDRRFEGNDRTAASDEPLQSLLVVVNEPGRREHVYWRGIMRRSDLSRSEVQQVISLTSPPPYEIRMMTLNPVGYRLCPNSPANVTIGQRDFDGTTNERPGSGRNTAHSWYFWSCRG